MFLVEAKRIFIVIIGSLMNAIALNFFMIKANVYASGLTGISQLLSSVFKDFIGFEIAMGLLVLLLNIPVALLGWYKVGKGFTIYSIISVGFLTLFLEILPTISVSNDIMLNAVFGGVISGVGIGITLKAGASTGGMDIIAMVLAKIKDKPIGTYLLLLNAVIITLAGILYLPENALYTLITLYVTTRVIDTVHTSQEKLTVMIITRETKALQEAIHDKMIRGITIIPAKGAYTNEDKNMLYLVITRYELYDLEKIIHQVDPNAFTNMVKTTGVLGFFRKNQ